MFTIDLEGKIAVITGGGGDIGGAIAGELAGCGALVAVTGRTIESAEKVVKKITVAGGKAKAYKLDVADEAEIYSVIDQVASDFGTIDILSTSHVFKGDDSLGKGKFFVDQPNEIARKTMEINLLGTAYCAKAALQYMIPQKSGKIIFISSIAGRSAEPTVAAYSMSKAAVISMTQALARAHGRDNINVNCICPGFVLGNLWNSALDNLQSATGQDREMLWKKSVLNRIPLRRAQDPEDFGYLAAFLASEYARNITGQTINIDGGTVMN